MNELELLLKSEKIDFVKEHKFSQNRKYKFDFAILKYKIAIEYEGGVYTGGRHIRPGGYIEDCRKYNLAVLKGWRVLRYTVEDLKDPNYIIEQIKEAMK